MKRIAVSLALLHLVFAISSINYMNQLMMIPGAQPYGMYGQGLAALDFNGDSYDDLAVLQNMWVPDSLQYLLPNIGYGRILIYYGGPGFDSTPDFILEGAYNRHLWQYGDSGYLADLGDVNGDGYDDLGVRGFTEGTGSFDTQRPYIAVYFGGANPSHQPGFYKVFTSMHYGVIAEIDPAGDINNDGYDDFFYEYCGNDVYPEERNTVGVILGGSMTDIVLRSFSAVDGATVFGVGDTNNDTYDDYIITHANIISSTNYTYSNILYFGSDNVQSADSLLLYSGHDITVFRTKHLGDLNGDNKDDFCGRIYFPNSYIWFGSEDITAQNSFALDSSWSGNGGDDRGLVYGDLNNDGYDDIIGSSPISHGTNGGFKVWLGGANMNGTYDLEKTCDYPGMLLGTGMAAGDFNTDGYSDIAASAPHSPNALDSGFGRVYIFSGNAQLADTTVGVEDNTAPSVIPDWDFIIIPNPRLGKQDWKLQFQGEGYNKYQNMSITIHNIKGQKVKSFRVSQEHLRSKEMDIPDINLPTGIYEVSIYNHGKLLKSHKATIK